MAMTTGQRVLWAVTVLAALAIGAGGTTFLRREPEGPPPVISLEKMGQLVSLRVNVADVVEFTEHRTFDIPWSLWEVRYAGTRVLLIVKGDCLVATDLTRARYERIEPTKRTVVIALPRPSVLQARVNHAPPEQGGSRIYAISNEGIEAIIPGDASRTQAIDGAMRLAQRRVEAGGRKPEVTRVAMENAELMLKGALGALGWTASFRWE